MEHKNGTVATTAEGNRGVATVAGTEEAAMVKAAMVKAAASGKPVEGLRAKAAAVETGKIIGRTRIVSLPKRS